MDGMVRTSEAKVWKKKGGMREHGNIEILESIGGTNVHGSYLNN